MRQKNGWLQVNMRPHGATRFVRGRLRNHLVVLGHGGGTILSETSGGKSEITLENRKERGKFYHKISLGRGMMYSNEEKHNGGPWKG